jgi:hypothetical protein
VREVAGGCLCCAVAAPFTVAVTQVLRRAKPDRLFIEPSGMGHPGGLFDSLSGGAVHSTAVASHNSCRFVPEKISVPQRYTERQGGARSSRGSSFEVL